MGKNIRVHIAEPCREQWDKMTSAEKGRFCASCQKQVIDFSDMSDREIATFFKRPSATPVCGRFAESQMNRDMGIPKKRMPWVKYFFQVAIPVFLMSAKAAGQKPATDTTVCQRIVLGQVSANGKLPPAKVDHTVRGIVTDEKGNPLSRVAVTIKGTSRMIKTDKRGNFRIKNINPGESIVFVVAVPGYHTVERNLQASDCGYVRISITRSEFVMGEMAVIRDGVVPKSLPSFKIFPQVTEKNTELLIECRKPVKEGYYTFSIWNEKGRSVQKQEIWIDKGAKSMNFEVPGVYTGNYYLQIVHADSGAAFRDKITIG
jgi:hypothetical protein